MCAANHPGEGSKLYEAVRAVGMDLCPRLGVTIPVGKDSMSMQTRWRTEGDGEVREVVAPVSLIVTAYGPTEDSRRTLTPELFTEGGEGEGSLIVFLDLGMGRMRMGGGALAQSFNQVGDVAPDLDDPSALVSFWEGMRELQGGEGGGGGVVLAYHDRSDGGLFTTIAEMCFAGHTGCEIDVGGYLGGDGGDVVSALFNEELGGVLQVSRENVGRVKEVFGRHGFPLQHFHVLGEVKGLHATDIVVKVNGERVYSGSRVALHRLWAETSYRMQAARGNPYVAEQEFNVILDERDPGIHASLTFNPLIDSPLRWVDTMVRPRVAVLREQGINSHVELAHAFHVAGFDVTDVHMTDVLTGRVSLSAFTGLGMPGGFSYGDVLGAGSGWARSVLLNPLARREMQMFFERPDT
ncbi:hypothetical protein HDU67_004967, partial [Dinochytrium kinnereticum]